ncbi:efflux RND transporter permease subunit [Echinimonas agarilytica]|uniref:Efflux RND transporter permease subunit n=1 Tax=Echinimonas agarilytica TaxID=1215918 RepID=A0AA41W9Q7_9GAMM|nr:efflux RND transporter permease subunit [Echinimonas agarilytica]MCM2681390.1 efflux RND transporter permease subunit [Echinimonas agarilytica]
MQDKSVLAWWIKNPIAANLAMISLIIAGIMSYLFSVEKEPFPKVNLSIMDIQVRWAGASPRDIEDQIMIRFEEAVKNVEGVKSIVSNAGEGWTRISITGEERVDRRKFADDIRERINSVNGLPADADRPIVTERTNRDQMIRVALYGYVDELLLNKVAREVRREVAALPLISSVGITGDIGEEISIEISEQKLRQYHLSFDEVSNAIKNNSVNTSAGTVRSDTESYTLSVRSRAERQADFENLVIRHAEDGATLYLGDVAQVVDGLMANKRFSSFDGEPAVLIDVLNSDYMNIPEMSATVREYIAQKQSQLPDGLKLTVWEDWNDTYQSRIDTILTNAVSGLILVFCLLMLFLQPKVALWVTIGIGTAFAAGFWLLPSFDVSLNMMSLFAFMMVIGIVVDDAIVIGESIHRKHEEGFHGAEAAYQGVKEVSKPVLFGVITTIVVFAPMAFLPGSTAEFTRAISIVVVLALGFSLFEALFILPSHLRHLPDDDPHRKESKLETLRKRFSNIMLWLANAVYKPTMHYVLNYRYIVVAIFIVAFGLSVKLLNDGYVLESFEPKIEADTIRLNVTLPENAAFERLQQVLEQMNRGHEKLDAYIAEHHEDDGSGQHYAFVEHHYSQIRGSRIASYLKLVPYQERAIDTETATRLLTEFIGDIPDAEEIEFKATLNQRDPKVALMIQGEDVDAMARAVADLKAHMAEYENVYLIRDNLDKGSKELVFSLKPGAESLGISLRDVGTQVRQAFFGQEVQRLPREGGDSRVRVRYSRLERESIDSIYQFQIRTRDKREVPLLSVVDVEIKPGVSRIQRRDGKKTVWIWAEYAGNDAWRVVKKIKEDFIPEWRKRHPQVNLGKRDGSHNKQQFMETVYHYEGLALLVCYMLMAIAFKSYLKPLLIMSAIPFAFSGAIFGHLGHNVHFGAFSMLGILAAAGVVVNDNLVLVDCLNKLRAKGLGVFEAVLEAGTLRFRPILLTSLTTFVGLVPMLSGDTEQAKFLVPMVVSLSYGVVFATLTTLIFTPCLYLVGTDIVKGSIRLFHYWRDLDKVKS